MPFPLPHNFGTMVFTTVETVPVKLQDLVVADGTRIAEVVDASLRWQRVFGVQHRKIRLAQ